MTSYDQVRYPNWPNPRTHPGHLGALAQLLGRPAAPATACRVLEIGCSEGVNLASLAVAAPESEYLGIDIAETAITRGRALMAQAGLDNVSLKVADVREAHGVEGTFDYIIAHGVYAWTPLSVREALMEALGRHLSRDGIGFLSYNVYPGCRVRQTIRDYVTYILDGISDPHERMAEGRSRLEYQMDGWSPEHAFQKALIEAAENILTRPLEVLFHDEMGPWWEPQFLSDVVGAARVRGLAYLADAHPASLNDGLLPSVRFDAARKLTGGDWARFEQLCDFTDLRPFRWSLFVRDGPPIERIATPDRVAGLWASAEISRVASRADTKRHVFKSSKGAELETDSDTLGELLTMLSRETSVSLEGIAAHSDVVEAVLRLYVNEVVTLSTTPPIYTRTPGEQPLASPVARAQARAGEDTLAGLHHKPVRLENTFWTSFVQQLDGKHNRAALATFISETAGKSLDEAAALVPAALEEVAGHKLLIA